MKLSVIIVNYNVQHFLEQCLHSVLKAANNLPVEIFVVDNNSVDGSVAVVKQKFPIVKLIENKQNLGFSKANNQAISLSTGKYILLLNPDTVVEEDTFEKIITFMDAHPDAGGLGVKMIDGKGQFLPESKRGLPTPWVAFYKIFGLSALFPKSKQFGKYHLGYLDKEKTHPVEILSGAFMLLRKEALDKTGLLDETFFMYGEDIDLSYRLLKAGYNNYYFPETRIIHYKGESTKKSSVNYVFVFYNAMIIFANKHFASGKAKTFSFLIKIAIYIRAAVALLNRFLLKSLLPLTDATIIFTGIFFIKKYYESNIRFAEGGAYPPQFLFAVIPLYIITWIISIFFSGGYDKPISLLKTIRGVFAGTAIILIAYGLLPEYMRFSRAIILLGAVWTLAAITTTRLALHYLKLSPFLLEGAEHKRIAIVGNYDECKRIEELLKQTTSNAGFICFVSAKNPVNNEIDFAGSLERLPEIIEIYRITEVIFSAKDIASNNIIDQMSVLGRFNIHYKICPPESMSIIGSNSINTNGELYVIDINSITKASNKRNKRLLDIFVSFALLFTYPLNILIIKKPIRLLKNILGVISGSITWVGYNVHGDYHNLPLLPKGILSPADMYEHLKLSKEALSRINILYAKDYKTANDVEILIKGFKKLGKSPQKQQ